ncbi:hypothetical protein ACN38_g793 [Penicillium nordicum]|uniref:Uncharacterized protein n=1 Tax=Penicillium nordicum TaxID=229535 RepID=A0A0M9WKG8_9EURO|nr:hypothetical protein ACN38_g793 [Penicillium nordicum]
MAAGGFSTLFMILITVFMIPDRPSIYFLLLASLYLEVVELTSGSTCCLHLSVTSPHMSMPSIWNTSILIVAVAIH